MRKFITKNIAYPLQDFYNKTSILSTHNFLLESQYWSETQIIDYQFNKFKILLEHSYRNVPYYNSLFSSIKLKPNDIRRFDDLYKIPILTKEKARKENVNMVARNISKKHVLKGVTGGTTGPPLSLLRDRSDLSFTWAAFFRWYNWMGVEIGDPIAKIWGTPTVLRRPLRKRLTGKVKNWYYNRCLINSFNLNDSTIPKAIQKLNDFRPMLIRGYLSALIQFAEFIRDNNVSLTYRPLAVSSTTETLLEPFRQLVQKYFNAPLYNQYGCGECNSIAFDSGDGMGLYIASEHVHLEILNDSGLSVTNQNGRIILTNLDNFIMPFIRYENGDYGVLSEDIKGKRINFPILKNISGRSADTIMLANKSKVHGVFFTDILNELFKNNPDYVHRFQVFQDKPGEIEFRIESKKGLDDIYLKKLETALKRYFTKIEIQIIEKFPLDPSGKFRYIISSLN